MKQRITQVIVGLALLLAVLTGSGIVADSLGLLVTPTVHACGGGSGGEC